MAWREIPQRELREWNQRLLHESAASIRQYPLFNEGLRGSGALWVTIPGRYASLIAWARRWTTTPRYLLHQGPDGPTSFACIVTIGVPGFRVGCIMDGPVTLDGSPIQASVIQDLVAWARRHHYIALRVTHSDEAFLQSLSGVGRCDRIDAVPFYPRPTSELYVDISGDDATIQSRFQAVARRNIRQARDARYEISIDHEPRALEKAWPAFESRSEQKGISYRNQNTYARMMREAEPHGAAHLYTAWLDGRPIAAILNLRDRTTAHYFLGTIDTNALGDAPSPAALLHWTAMKHAAEMGATFYNLGTRSGPVYTFKAKFRPVEHDRPEPLTLIVNPTLYGMWQRLLPSLAQVVQ
jgi:hypothetical protein